MMIRLNRERGEPIYVRHDQISSICDGEYGHRPSYVRLVDGSGFETTDKADDICRLIAEAEKRATVEGHKLEEKE